MMLSSYLISFLTLMSIYMILTISLNMLIGQVGVFSLAHAGIFGVGAYTTGIAMTRYEQSFVVALFLGFVAAGLVSAVAALPSLRVGGDFFVVASLGVQMVVETMISSLEITGGELGLRGIPRPEIFGQRLYGESLLWATVVACLLVYLFLRVLMASQYGRIINAIREDESMVVVLGYRARNYKVSVAVLAGAIAGTAGAFYAGYLTFLSPSNFDSSLSIRLSVLVIVGGMFSLTGAVVGTAVVLAIPEILKSTLDVSPTVAGPVYQMLFGLALIALMYLRPAGLVGPPRSGASVVDRARDRLRWGLTAARRGGAR